MEFLIFNFEGHSRIRYYCGTYQIPFSIFINLSCSLHQNPEFIIWSIMALTKTASVKKCFSWFWIISSVTITVCAAFLRNGLSAVSKCTEKKSDNKMHGFVVVTKIHFLLFWNNIFMSIWNMRIIVYRPNGKFKHSRSTISTCTSRFPAVCAWQE